MTCRLYYFYVPSVGILKTGSAVLAPPRPQKDVEWAGGAFVRTQVRAHKFRTISGRGRGGFPGIRTRFSLYRWVNVLNYKILCSTWNNFIIIVFSCVQ